MNSSLNLPLSWKISNITEPDILQIKLNSNANWLALAELPYKIDVKDWLVKGNEKQKRILIRGCSESLAEYLNDSGYEKIQVGREAILEFNRNHFEKKSLKELIRRGKRFGVTIELEYNAANIEKLRDFKKECAHGTSPQLKNLFFDEFAESSRLFVFSTSDDKWLGAVLVSDNSGSKYHTELILRKVHAPVGIMEALIYDVFTFLSKTEKSELSLGEVPFVSEVGEDRFLSKTKLVKLSGRALKFAYNFEGLYAFKNKFQPRWENLYLCGKPAVNLHDLFSMAVKSNLLSLSLYKLVENLQNF